VALDGISAVAELFFGHWLAQNMLNAGFLTIAEYVPFVQDVSFGIHVYTISEEKRKS
jgi:hypothetical protein